MAQIESSSVSVSRGAPAAPGADATPTVIWVRGEHDMATRVHLSVTIAQAARLVGSDLVVDLSGVSFMDVSTVGALVVARNRLARRGRRLRLRAPSPRASRVLTLCGLEALVDHGVALSPDAAPALATWVAVPAERRRDLARSVGPAVGQAGSAGE